MAPVTFFRKSGNPVRPYYINPWHHEAPPPSDPVLAVLRGDFFCMPFGGNSTPFNGELHAAHGETATSDWELSGYEESGEDITARFLMETNIRKGRIIKTLRLREGHNGIYISHELHGFSGPMSLGHHATLSPPGPPDDPGALLISTSPVSFCMTNPTEADYWENGEYYCLEPGKEFTDLSRVPTIWKNRPYADCSVFPLRRGFTDILQIYRKPAAIPAWTVASAPSAGYLWFSLKNPAVLPSTLVWMENGGRYSPPWNGRNCCIGLEEICGYFAFGLKESQADNTLNSRGIRTSHDLSTEAPLIVRTIQGVARIDPRFGRVSDVRFGRDSMTFLSDTGSAVEVKVDINFIG